MFYEKTMEETLTANPAARETGRICFYETVTCTLSSDS
jgi:hypothetical protein